MLLIFISEKIEANNDNVKKVEGKVELEIKEKCSLILSLQNEIKKIASTNDEQNKVIKHLKDQNNIISNEQNKLKTENESNQKTIEKLNESIKEFETKV